MSLQTYAAHLTLGALLDDLRARAGGYQLLDHWQQGEFHHDTLLRIDAAQAALPGCMLVVATNCNGGIKELLCFGQRPERDALWHQRCPDNREFSGELPELLASSRTLHWFDPCALLGPDARSEYRAEYRQRQAGGGWTLRSCGVAADKPGDEAA